MAYSCVGFCYKKTDFIRYSEDIDEKIIIYFFFDDVFFFVGSGS